MIRTYKLRSAVAILSLVLAMGGMVASPPLRHKKPEVSTKIESLTGAGERLRNEKTGRRHVAPQSGDSQVLNSFGKMAVKRASAAYASVADVPAIYGCVYYTGSREPIEQTVCKIPTAPGQKFELVVSGVNAIDGGTAVGDTYYAAYHTEYYGEYQLYINGYNLATGATTVSKTAGPEAEATDVAHNPVDGKVYGCFADPDSPDYSDYYFGTIDYQTGTVTKISMLPRQLAAIAINRQGRIYVIDKRQEKSGYTLETVGADLYEIDAATGEMSFIGTTGQKPSYRSSAAIDPVSGRMFWTVSPDDECGYLYEVDTTTGSAMLVYQFPDDEEIVGLYIPDTGVTLSSPAAPTGLTAVFPGGGLNGTVTFTLPSVDISGNSLSGPMDYTVSSGSDVLATGSGLAGTQVNAQVTVGAEGLYHISVTASNQGGVSPEAKISVFVGHDTPATPVVDAKIAGDEAVVTWLPVTCTVNGGDLSGEEVLYIVRRLPDGKVVADSQRECSATDNLGSATELTSYIYTVEATANGVTSLAGQSPKVVAGHVTLPYEEDFNNIATFDFFTVIDANGDGNRWGPYIGNIRVSFSDDKTLAMDDWLISPPMMLRQGEAYRFSVDVATGSAAAEECFEVKWGTAPTVADMTGTVIERQSVAHDGYVTYYGYVSPQTTGLHYIGFHGCSEPDRYTITVDNMTVEEGIDARLPAEATGLSVKSRTNGELKADITFFAPDVTLGGQPLESLAKVNVWRGNKVVETFMNPEPGQRLSCVDEVEGCMTCTYSVSAFTDAGEGPRCSVTTFVGVLSPADPQNVVMVETSTPGEVTVSWEAPAVDIEGNQLDPQYITYGIYTYNSASGELDPLCENLTVTSHTFVASTEPEIQRFAQYFVAAKTLGGYSDGIATPIIPVGNAYPAPFRESFSMGRLNSIVATNTAGGAAWKLFDESGDVLSVDADNGFIGSQATGQGQYSTLYTGKVGLSALTNPMLTFYVYNIVDEHIVGEDVLDVDVVADGVAAQEWSDVISALSDDEGWIKVSVPLRKYAGKDVRFCFTAHHNTWDKLYIDRISVIDDMAHNLTAGAISAPDRVKAGSTFTVSATVDNNGTSRAEGYTVELYCNGSKVDSKAGAAIESDRSATVEFLCTIPAVEEAAQTYGFNVVYAADMNDGDNESGQLTVSPVFATLPYVKDLTAEVDADGVALKWSAPDEADYIPDAVTDDFESYASWATSGAGEWIFVDKDGAGIGGFNDGTQFPGIASNSVQSFWVFDSEGEGFKGDVYFMSHSGTKHLAQMFSYTTAGEVQCDDWAISPRLHGCAQTVTFYARCYYGNYPESFEVLYSTGGTDVDDFISVGNFRTDSDNWMPYSVELPEGAGRFAIRCVSKGGFMFFVDDVSYIPVAAPGEIEHQGYNIYRDKVFVERIDAGRTDWIDAGAQPSARNEYVVTAIYNRGESRPSNVAVADGSGVGSVTAGNVSVSGVDGAIVVSGAPAGAAIEVWRVDGVRVASAVATGASVTRVPAVAGLYVVNVGGVVTSKVAVR